MLQTPSTFNPAYNPNVPYTSQMNGSGLTPGMMNQNMQGGGTQGGYPMDTSMASGMGNGPMPDQMDQMMGDPQTQSYAHGGRTRKRRSSMVEAYMGPDEIATMVDAQGGPEYDRKTGRHIFKKLSRFLENPHVERSIKNKFACGGRINYAEGGSTRYSMPRRSPASDENYARGGDTDLVYITPYMDKMFKQIGAHSQNPVTGHSEYFGMNDILGGIKNYGSQGIGLLNDYAPEISAAAMPLAASLPGWQGKLAAGALGLAPAGINKLNSYVNPDRSQMAPDSNRMLAAQTFGQLTNSIFNQPGNNVGQFAGNVFNGAKNAVGNAAANGIMALANPGGRNAAQIAAQGNAAPRIPFANGRPIPAPMAPQNAQLPQQYGQQGSNEFLQQLVARLQAQNGNMNSITPQMHQPQNAQPPQNLLQEAFGSDPFPPMNPLSANQSNYDLYGGNTQRQTPSDAVTKYLAAQQRPGSLRDKMIREKEKYLQSNNWADPSDGFVSNWPNSQNVDPRYQQLKNNNPNGQSYQF